MNQVHSSRFGVISSPNRSVRDLEEELVAQYGRGQFLGSPARQSIGNNRAFSSPCRPEELEAAFDAQVSDGPVQFGADSRDDDTDMNQYYFDPMFVAQDASDSFSYEATPSYNTSDGTFERQLVLTPQTTSRACSGRATLDSDFETQDSILPVASPSWNSDHAMYDYPAEVDPRRLVLRSQTDLPDLGSSIPFVTPHSCEQEFDVSTFLNDDIPEPVANTSRFLVDPWNSEAAVDNPYYGPGYSAFLHMSGPTAVYDNMQKESSPQVSEGVQGVQGDKPRRTSVQSKQAESQELQWQHSFLADGSLQNRKKSNESTKDSTRSRRIGPLSPEKAKKAVEVRKKGACWPCWNRHVPCDTAEVCLGCQKRAQSMSLTRSCCYRQDLVDSGPLFFPPAMVAHLKEGEIQTLMNEHISRFTDHTFAVEITSGYSFEPMRLVVRQFSHRTDDLVYHHQTRIQSDGEMQRSQTFCHNGAPLGLEHPLDMEVLKQSCEAHIWSMVENSLYASQSTAGQSTKIPNSLLGIMQEYCRERPEEKNGLLHRAMRLHAMHHFMGRIISFTPASTRNLLHIFGWQYSSEFEFFSSRLLNRQIKYAMHLIHQMHLIDVLRDLHDEIRKKSPESWTSSFCTIVVLCLCVEELQVAVDGFTTFTIDHLSGSPKKVSQNGLDTCRRLDQTIEMFMEIFHLVYGTRNRKKTKKVKSGEFNPLLNGPGAGANMGDAAVNMVRKVREVIEANREEMQELKEPVFDSDIFPPSEIDLAMRNPGRLLSQFLLPFLY